MGKLNQYAIKPPALTPNEISDMVRDIEYGGVIALEKINDLIARGQKYIDGYHVVSSDQKEQIAVNGIRTGDEWYDRDESVYFFADPDDIILAIPFLAMKVDGEDGGTVSVVHFRMPVEDIKNMEWDDLFNVGFETYSALRIKKDILPGQIIDYKLFNIPSAKDFKS